MQTITQSSEHAPEQQSWHTRTARGVITQYEIFTNGGGCLVELWRGKVARNTCGRLHCQHGRLALLLEDQYQEAHKDHNLGTCIYCGCMAKIARGVAICSRCL